jgi:BetI-type transcriptional repressor, C-terminal
VLFSEFRVHAARSPSTRRKLAQRRREIRATLAETVEGYAKRAGVELTMPPDHVATLLLALTNGLALERLGQPEAVPDELFGEVIARLFSAP